MNESVTAAAAASVEASAAAQAPSERTRVRRSANRSVYDRDALHAVIDAAYLCHVAFYDDRGPHCIPTACWREGEHLYVHGSNGSRMIKRLLEADSCTTITHIDGLVLARSAFNHSMNYRSAMIYGRYERVEGGAKRPAMAAFMDSLLPGRKAEVRPGNDQEYAATTVLRIALTEAACKIRSGGPNDDEADMRWPVWTGVLPLAQVQGEPAADPASTAPMPDYVRSWPARQI
ncbi:pyridoxamine 5'-phosphate oxidase family protein [Rugamonas sp.]|uniref:pyridoxamine 5'-phosphate oxidase family protein n=1 Tax=Rugamonas sp. TaxID=1926287 RepID=UPI0025FEF22F|nr:pyridoxamine 5'-phosphate oxidase family protein [Rugamonas sp.]